MNAIYQMGDANYIGYFASGSSFSARIEDYPHYGSPVVQIQKSVWVCHYCGSTQDDGSLKCTQCAGERRQDKRSSYHPRATIEYVSEVEPQIDFVPSREKHRDLSWLSRLFGRG